MTHKNRAGKPKAASPRLLKKLGPVLIVLIAATVVAWLAFGMPSNTEKPVPTETPPVPVVVEVVQPVSELADTFVLPGVVEPNRVVTVAAEVAERIEQIPVEQGTRTRKGQTIIKLNRELLRAELERAEAQARYDSNEYERISALHRQGAATAKELEEALTARKISQANLAAARERYERTIIKAPVSGILNELPVEVGEYVQPGMPVAEIVDVDTVKVVVQVPERDIHFLKVGQREQIHIDPRGGITVTGTISYISELADGQTRTTRVEITVDNKRHLLRSGQIVRVRLTRRTLKDIIMIPLGAVIPLENGRVVYVVVDGKAQRRNVELGLIRGTKVQVKSGLQAGERLIVDGLRYVGPGQAVREVN